VAEADDLPKLYGAPKGAPFQVYESPFQSNRGQNSDKPLKKSPEILVRSVFIRVNPWSKALEPTQYLSDSAPHIRI
jgi:hypothetical protein